MDLEIVTIFSFVIPNVLTLRINQLSMSNENTCIHHLYSTILNINKNTKRFTEGNKNLNLTF